jgi:hypothetical protein
MEQEMPSLGKTAFKGASGQVYGFKVYALGTHFRKLSGVYVVTTRSSTAAGGHRHRPLYVGQTEDLSQPLGRHRKAGVFREHGANCVCLLSDASKESRVAKERDLIAAFQPVCND